MDKIEALMRGLGQGATGGWADEAAPYLTRFMEAVAGGPDDPAGIPRNYAAGSATADQQNVERAANADAAAKYPGTYGSGQALGSLAPSLALGAAGAAGTKALPLAQKALPLAQRVALGGLTQGVRGGIEGAGYANEGDRLQGAAQAAGPAALMGMGAAAAPAALGAVKNAFKGGPPPGGLSPALATAGGPRMPTPAPTPKVGGIGVNMSSSTMPVPRPGVKEARKPPSTPPRPKPVREADKSAPPENVPQTKAEPPPMGAREGKGKIPKAPKMPSMSARDVDELSERYDVNHGKKVLQEMEDESARARAIREGMPKQANIPAEFRGEGYDWGWPKGVREKFMTTKGQLERDAYNEGVIDRVHNRSPAERAELNRIAAARIAADNAAARGSGRANPSEIPDDFDFDLTSVPPVASETPTLRMSSPPASVAPPPLGDSPGTDIEELMRRTQTY